MKKAIGQANKDLKNKYGIWRGINLFIIYILEH